MGIGLAAALACPVDLQAQTTSATLRGTVADEQGAALPGASLTARNVDTNASLGVISSAIAVLVMAFLGAAMWVAFKAVFDDADQRVQTNVNNIGS